MALGTKTVPMALLSNKYNIHSFELSSIILNFEERNMSSYWYTKVMFFSVYNYIGISSTLPPFTSWLISIDDLWPPGFLMEKRERYHMLAVILVGFKYSWEISGAGMEVRKFTRTGRPFFGSHHPIVTCQYCKKKNEKNVQLSCFSM